MSLEEALAKNTAALEALTKAMGGAKVSAPASSPAPASAPAAAAYTPRHDKEEMKAMLGKVKEKHGVPVAKAIIKAVGKVEKMDDITDPKVIDAVYDDAETKWNEDGI